MTAITTTTTALRQPAKQSLAPLTVETVSDAATRARWQHYAERTPSASMFHQLDWANVVTDCFGHTPQHLLARRGDAVVGILPLHEIRSPLLGRLLVSVPYATYGGIVADDEEAREGLVGAALRLVYEQQAQLLQLRSEHADIDGFECDERYAYFRRALPVDLDGLQRFLPRRARAAARQAEERDGLVAIHDAAQLPLVYDLYVRSMRRLASPNFSRRFFDRLAETYGNNLWVTLVYHDKQPLAGVISFVYRDSVTPYYLGIDERYRGTGVSNLLYRAVMERAVRAQLRWFDYGRTRYDNRGPFGFKKNQGFEPRTLGYQYYVPPGGNAPDLTPDNPRFRLARQAWQRLPLALTRPLGACVSRWTAG